MFINKDPDFSRKGILSVIPLLRHVKNHADTCTKLPAIDFI
jgi:hypothetical protein